VDLGLNFDMENIKITFLGTSQAIPTISRNHTSILLNYKYENILVDCGEGTQRQFRKAKINPCKTSRLLITHWHGDHVLGIPGLFQTLNLNNYSKTLFIYGPNGTKKFIREIMKIFIYKPKFKIVVEEVSGKFFENDDFSLEAVSLEHGVPTNGYIFREKDRRKIDKEKLQGILRKFKVDGFDMSKIARLSKGENVKIKGKLLEVKKLTSIIKGRKVSFIFDTGYCANALKLAKESELSIIESTYGSDRNDLAKKYKHLSSEMAALIAKKSGVRKLILTHISQIYEYKEKVLLNEAKKIFDNVEIAEDLMVVEV